MIDKFARPAAARRRGEAPRVASRGEHGHSLVITQPMIRFCPDRDERRARLFFLFFRVSRRRRDGSARASDRLRLTVFSLEQIPHDRRERDAPTRCSRTLAWDATAKKKVRSCPRRRAAPRRRRLPSRREDERNHDPRRHAAAGRRRGLLPGVNTGIPRSLRSP